MESSNNFLNIQLNEAVIEQIYRAELQKKIEKLEKETVFWDTKELTKQTKMAWSTIQEKFFFDPRFEECKAKIGKKWFFHSGRTKAFLEIWFEEQRNKQFH